MATRDAVYVPPDYICVIDFEATCIQQGRKEFYPHEIIEFPAVLIDVSKLEIVATFHSFVRPHLNRKLSEFCISLTGIDQVTVDNADSFENVLPEFEQWLENHVPLGANCVILTDGSEDLNTFLPMQCWLRSMAVPLWATKWIDIKRIFQHYNKSSSAVLTRMLDIYGMSFEGRLHSGKDDAYNIARLAIEMIKRGYPMKPTARLSARLSDFNKKLEAFYGMTGMFNHEKRPRKKGKSQSTVSGACGSSSMDIDPDLIGCESALVKYKKKY